MKRCPTFCLVIDLRNLAPVRTYTVYCSILYMYASLSYISHIYVWLVNLWLVWSNSADRKLSEVDYFKVESFDLFKSTLCSEQANAMVLRGQLLSLNAIALFFPFVLLFSLLSLSLSLPSFPTHPAAVTVLVFDPFYDLHRALTTQGTSDFYLHRYSSTQPSAMCWTCGSWMVEQDQNISAFYEQSALSHFEVFL